MVLLDSKSICNIYTKISTIFHMNNQILKNGFSIKSIIFQFFIHFLSLYFLCRFFVVFQKHFLHKCLWLCSVIVLNSFWIDMLKKIGEWKVYRDIVKLMFDFKMASYLCYLRLITLICWFLYSFEIFYSILFECTTKSGFCYS